MQPPFAYFSNQVECLYRTLRQNLFHSGPFTKRLIIVPSPAMRSWLLLQMAQDPELGIAAGLEIGFVDQSMMRILDLTQQKRAAKRHTEMEIAMALEFEIRTLLSDKTFFEICEPLINYLTDSDTKRREKRIIALSIELARLFVEYGKYGKKIIEEWNQSIPSNWQHYLWLKLENRFAVWEYPCRKLTALKDCFLEAGDVQVHLFALSFVSSLHHKFLNKIHAHIPVSYYLLSPCQKFWSDLLSNRESLRLKNYWKKQGVSQSQQLALDEYLRDSNALLANFGKMGREMAVQIEQSGMQTHEAYLLPTAVHSMPQYQDLLAEDVGFTETGHPLTILEAVQADMVLLRNPETSEKIFFESHDRTIQVHASPKKGREIEILYNVLLGIIEKHSEEPISPGEIVVMAPDISNYEPYIKKVFNSLESVLDAQIIDLQMPSQNLIAQGFLHLLQIAFGRWDAADILHLIDYAAFQHCHQLNADDVQQIRIWIKELGIRWGNDLSHRKELLKRDHCFGEMVENGEQGTWEYGFGRLLSSLSCNCEENLYIETSQGNLLGKFLKLLRSLFSDLKPLNDGTRLTLHEWSVYLDCLFTAYFAMPNDEADENAKQLRRHLDGFKEAAQSLGGTPLPFLSIKEHFENCMRQQTAGYRENHLHAVRFCSMMPMRTIPAKVVVLLGMNEGAFPRQDNDSSLNLLTGHPKADYFPTRVDFDRYLFLEALLSARRYFILSYVSLDASDPKELPPSLLVTELLSYMDQAFAVSEGKVSEITLYKHPFFSFDKEYFSGNAPFPSYSNVQFQAAKAYYEREKKTPHAFVPDFSIHSEAKDEQVLLIELSDLLSFARNPIKAYFNKTLGIYLEREEDRVVKTEEEWQLSNLDLFLLERKGLRHNVEDVLQQGLKMGTFPQGAFKLIAIQKLTTRIDEISSFLTKLNITPSSIFDIELDPYCQTSTQIGNYLRVPALSFHEDISVKIVGRLSDVTSEGLLLLGKDDHAGLAKVWPALLVFSCLHQREKLPVQKQWLFVKKGKIRKDNFVEPEAILKKFVDYYLRGLQALSPLIPEWINPMITLDQSGFEKAAAQHLDESFSQLNNEYLKWMVRSGELPEGKGYTAWRPVALDVFSSVLEGNHDPV